MRFLYLKSGEKTRPSLNRLFSLRFVLAAFAEVFFSLQDVNFNLYEFVTFFNQ